MCSFICHHFLCCLFIFMIFTLLLPFFFPLVLYYINKPEIIQYYFDINGSDIKSSDIRWNGKSSLYHSKYIMIPIQINSTINPYTMYVRKSNDLISSTIIQYGKWPECEDYLNIFKDIENSLHISGSFLDIGGNIGACSLLFLSYNIKTIIFEPMPDNLNLLTNSLLINPLFLNMSELYPIALGEKNGKGEIKAVSNNWGGSSLVARIPRLNNKIIKIFTLDEILKDRDEKFLLTKIDVEGYEYNVLKGSIMKLKSKNLIAIILEVNCFTLKSANITPLTIFKFLEDVGYVIYNKMSRICEDEAYTVNNVLVIHNTYYNLINITHFSKY